MVLDHGKIKEFENPNSLLANPQSSFYAMCKDAGLVASNNNGASNSPGSDNNGNSSENGKSNGSNTKKSTSKEDENSETVNQEPQ